MKKGAVYDLAIVGGGLVGLATAWSLKAKYPEAAIVLIEKEPEVARHQSGRNSGVLHSGVYYKHGSLKAELTKRGREAMLHFCDEYGIRYKLCGKLILATSEEEIPRLRELTKRGKEKGLQVTELDPQGIVETEPHAVGLTGIWIPETGVVDFVGVAYQLAKLLSECGVVCELSTEVLGVHQNGDELEFETNKEKIYARRAINCCGLFSDRLARRTGLEPGLRIIPFRGEYYKLKPGAAHLVHGLIYPLADPQMPFLGVHLTRTINDDVLAGPNAVFALHREGYHARDIKLSDVVDSLGYPGFWRLILRHLGTGLSEMSRAWSASMFTRSAKKLVPELKAEDFVPERAGVRAQAVDAKGNLVDDFRFVRDERWFHVLNAPSPAATACFAIGDMIAEQVGRTVN